MTTRRSWGCQAWRTWGARWWGVDLGPEDAVLGVEYVVLLLELGHADDRLGGSFLGLVERQREPAALGLGVVGPAGLGVDLAHRLGGAALGGDDRHLELGRGLLGLPDAGLHGGGELLVLGGALLGDCAVGLRLAGPVGRGFAAGLPSSE